MRLTKEVKGYLSKDLNISSFCVKAKMSRPTFFRRWSNPETFKASEIEVIKKMVGVSEIFETK